MSSYTVATVDAVHALYPLSIYGIMKKCLRQAKGTEASKYWEAITIGPHRGL